MITQTEYLTKLWAFKKIAGIRPKALEHIDTVVFPVIRQDSAFPYFIARHPFFHKQTKYPEKPGDMEKCFQKLMCLLGNIK